VPVLAPAPTALTLTADGAELYLASAVNDPAATAVNVLRFGVQRSAGVATGVTPAGGTQLCGMRHVLSLVEVPGPSAGQRRMWAFGFTGPTFTELPNIPGEENDPAPPMSDYATPMRADFAPGEQSATAAQVAAHASQPVTLPLSVIFRGSSGPTIVPADTNCDGDVSFFDIDPFLLALFDPTGYAAAYPACDIDSADCNSDGEVNFFDIDAFLACLFGSCP
jgi:hypothetical protein